MPILRPVSSWAMRLCASASSPRRRVTPSRAAAVAEANSRWPSRHNWVSLVISSGASCCHAGSNLGVPPVSSASRRARPASAARRFCTLAPRLASYWAVSRRSSKSPRCTCWPGCTSISRTMPPSRLCTSCRCDGGVMAPRPFTDTSSWANVAQASVSTTSTAISASMRMTRRRGSRSGSGCACGKGRACRALMPALPWWLQRRRAWRPVRSRRAAPRRAGRRPRCGHGRTRSAGPPAPAWPCGA